MEELLHGRSAVLAARRNQDLAERAGVAAAAREKVAVDDDPAADEPGDEHIEEFGIARRLPEEMNRGAAGGRVVAEIDGELGDPGDLGAEVERLPRLHGAARCTDLFLPVPQLERHGDADAGNPRPRFRGKPTRQRGAAGADEVEEVGRIGVGISVMQLVTNAADEVHQDDVGAAAPDLHPEGEGAVGIERQRDRGLADATALKRLAAQEPVALELADDLGDRRRRQSR